MEIYIPYYNHGWHIQLVDSEKVRRIGCYWTYRGTIYGPTAYTTHEGASAYIDKRYYEAQQSGYQIIDKRYYGERRIEYQSVSTPATDTIHKKGGRK